MLLLNTLKIQEKINENNPNSSSFIFRYLPPTMGLTVGNYLRRTLLSAIKGVAIVGVQISDKNGSVTNKFTTLTGVLETTPYLILNLKKLILQKKSEKEGIFCLELNIENKEKEERVILASDFLKSEEIEIINPELELATLATGSSKQDNPKLAIKLYCRESQGYHPVAKQKKEYEEHFRQAEVENIIILDTDYSPITGNGVNFQVNSVVTGIEEEQEELVLTITTAGAIPPQKALKEALEAINQMNNTIQKSLK